MIPSDCGATSTWTDAKRCVWGPPSLQLTTRYQLGHMYEHALQLGRAELEALSSFFRVTLGVRCVTLQDLTTELAALRDAGCSDLSRVGRVYECLSVLMTPETEQKTRYVMKTFLLFFCRNLSQKEGFVFLAVAEAVLADCPRHLHVAGNSSTAIRSY